MMWNGPFGDGWGWFWPASPQRRIAVCPLPQAVNGQSVDRGRTRLMWRNTLTFEGEQVCPRARQDWRFGDVHGRRC
jgi:hypothetical protein